MVNKLCQMLPRIQQEGKHPLSSRTEQSSRHIWQQILRIHFQKLRFLLVSSEKQGFLRVWVALSAGARDWGIPSAPAHAHP